ncbi:MAG TPA: hypothetical protein VFF81_07310 [Noviherbaspirillum sp.]|nr:hypothetical protein [Noviherbaspirillum sp.]
MPRLLQFGQRAAIAALALGYVLLAHYTNIAQTETLGTIVALAPIVFGGFSIAWNSSWRKAMLAAFAVACALIIIAWNRLEHHYSLIYWIEHAGTELVLCITFARTLAAGREPMCTYFARLVQGPLSPALERYTRQVTQAWVIFFGSMAAASTLLYYAAPLEIWSAFANFFTGPLIGLMFLGEYIVRRALHPNMQHAHILDAVKVFWKSPAR